MGGISKESAAESGDRDVGDGKIEGSVSPRALKGTSAEEDGADVGVGG